MTADFPEKLLEGYHNFTATLFSSDRQRYRQLTDEGQRTEILVIACCLRSRAAPELIFDTRPGRQSGTAFPVGWEKVSRDISRA